MTRCRHRARGVNLSLDLLSMFLDQRLDALARIAAGIEQILVGFVQFVFVEVELRLSQIQFVLQRIFLCRLCLCHLGRQIAYALLVDVKQGLRLADAIIDFCGLRIQRRRVCFDVAQGGVEGKIQRVIGNAQRRDAPSPAPPARPAAATNPTRWCT